MSRQEETNYRAGKQHGVARYYDMIGRLRYQVTYIEGKLTPQDRARLFGIQPPSVALRDEEVAEP